MEVNDLLFITVQ